MITSKQYVVTAQIPAIIQDLGLSLPRAGAVLFLSEEQHAQSNSLRDLVKSRAVVVREIDAHRFRHVPSPSNSTARRPTPADLSPPPVTNLRNAVTPPPPSAPTPAPVDAPSTVEPTATLLAMVASIQREITTLTKDVQHLSDLRSLLTTQLEAAGNSPRVLPTPEPTPEPAPVLTNSLGIDMDVPLFIPSNLVDANTPSIKVAEGSHESTDVESSVAALRKAKRGAPK